MMQNDSLWEETIQPRMDRLIQSREVRPMILVLPDASTSYGGSQYLNSSATGNYEDHILELVRHIDQKYRTIPERNFRGVAGKSSGGYGATMFGMHHPDVFGLVADHSGDKYFELCYKPDFPKFLSFYGRVGEQGVRDMLNNPGKSGPKPGDYFGAVGTCAMASCYSPNPSVQRSTGHPARHDRQSALGGHRAGDHEPADGAYRDVCRPASLSPEAVALGGDRGLRHWSGGIRGVAISGEGCSCC
jgi:hypothetical protein